MNKLYFSFLSLCMGMPLWAADFSGSIAHVSNDNNTIIVTELPVESYYTAYMTMTLDVAAIQTYISKSSGNPTTIASFQVAESTAETCFGFKNNACVVHSGNSYRGMLANLSISEPADVTASLERLDAIFTANVTNAALTLSYSKAGIIGYLTS